MIEGSLPRQKLPVIAGHQIVGEVDREGIRCAQFAVGRRVGVACRRHTCGQCSFCRCGRENLCEASRYTGYHTDGGYAEYAVVPGNFAYAIPDGFDDASAAPLLCGGIIGYRALRRARVPEGGTLLLVGFGSSAHLVLQIARHRGHVAHVLTRSESHQRLAEELGAAPGWVRIRAPCRALSTAPSSLRRRAGSCRRCWRRCGPVGRWRWLACTCRRFPHWITNGTFIMSVTSNTREDGRPLLTEAAAAGIQPRVSRYPLAEANRALRDMKESRFDGAGVLVVTD